MIQNSCAFLRRKRFGLWRKDYITLEKRAEISNYLEIVQILVVIMLFSL